MLVAMAISHDLHLTVSESGENILNGVSPDEIALVLAAKKLGVEFAQLQSIDNSADKLLTIKRVVRVDSNGTIHTEDQVYTLLYNLEFSSERKCASVLGSCINMFLYVLFVVK